MKSTNVAQSKSRQEWMRKRLCEGYREDQEMLKGNTIFWSNKRFSSFTEWCQNSDNRENFIGEYYEYGKYFDKESGGYRVALVSKNYMNYFCSYECETFKIPYGVTAINENAFYDNYRQAGEISCNKLIIPRSVKIIGKNAFCGCAIKEVEFEHEKGDELYIYGRAFGNTQISRVELPECAELEGGAVFGVTNRKFAVQDFELTVHRTLGGASARCLSSHFRPLVKLHLKDVFVIKPFKFEKAEQLVSITGMENATHIGERAFAGCSALSEIDLHNIKAIGSCAFKDCCDLQEIKLDNCEEIHDFAFSGCKSLKKVILGNKLKFIAENAFRGCENLESCFVHSEECKVLLRKEVFGRRETVEQKL